MLLLDHCRLGATYVHDLCMLQGQTLAEILSRPDYVVHGIPVFFVVAKGSRFAERFLSEDAYRP